MSASCHWFWARVARRALLLGVCACALGLSGCAIASLTGGSIPTGGIITRAQGVVVRADNPQVPLAGALLRFIPAAGRVIPGGGGTGTGGGGGTGTGGGGTGTGGTGSVDPVGTVRVRTGVDGTFSVAGLATGALDLEITPPAGTDLLTQHFALGFGSGSSYQLMLTLLPSSYNTALLAGATCTPLRVNAVVGQAVDVQVLLANGYPPSVAPSLLLAGDCGTVSTNGKFLAYATGGAELHVVLGPNAWSVPIAVTSPF